MTIEKLKDYVLAAGFDGKIALETDDAAGVTSFALSQYVVSDVDIYGTVVQADCMGNAYYDSQTTKWTDPNVSYYITGTVEGSIASKNAVKATVAPEIRRKCIRLCKCIWIFLYPESYIF